MLRRPMQQWVCALALALPLTATARDEGHRQALGPLFEGTPQVAPATGVPDPGGPERTIKRWNTIAIDASGLDHTPVPPGDPRTFGEQLGPGRSARAMAIVHIAMFDSGNAISRRYHGYNPIPHVPGATSFEVAVAQAARDTLVAMFPSQRATFDRELRRDLRGRPLLGTVLGAALGRYAAHAILARRANDGAQHAEPVLGTDYIPGDAPAIWRQDPISLIPLALGAHWAEVDPFVLASADQFRAPPPPAMDSVRYTAAYDEVQQLGGDGIVTPTVRTAEQTEIGIYWAYDGTPSLCAPPRLYNQIANRIADLRDTPPLERLRLLALANVAMADAGIAIWESKYHYALWRPVTGIRESDPGTGPTGAGDGNPATVGDPAYSPLGAPASNLMGPNFTPPFPAYPSGHAGFGGALFQTLRRFYGRDDIAFTFVSDEFNGVTVDNAGNVRPLRPRSFASFAQAEEENGQSRIYLGIHWEFDKTDGIVQGRHVADYVFDRKFRPRS